MECAEVTDRLWEYLDGELAAEEAVAVGWHLARCPACRPHHCCDRAFLLLLARSLACPRPAPVEIVAAVRTRLAAGRRAR